MFIGHLALGFAAKRAAPGTSLGVLLAASGALDILFPLFLPAVWERMEIASPRNPFLRASFTSYPWSHSVLFACLWAGLAGGAYWGLRRYRAGTIAVAALVVSHWVPDAVSHPQDMPLHAGDSRRAGLGFVIFHIWAGWIDGRREPVTGAGVL